MYKLFFTDGNAQQICDQIFNNFDTNKKGYLDFKEYLVAVDIANAKTAEEKLRFGFRRSLLINKRFALNEMFQQNASKFAIFNVDIEGIHKVKV